MTAGRRTVRSRLLPLSFVAWLVILLGVFRRLSYENLLGRLEGSWWTLAAWIPGRIPTDSAVTKARDRLGVEPLRVLYRRTVREWTSATSAARVYGRRVYLLDGTTFKVDDNEENRGYFGLPGTTRGRAGYPQMRAVMVIDLASRIVTAERHGPYRTSELALAREVVKDIEPGSLLLLDRNFIAYDLLWDVARDRASDFVVRAKRKLVLPVVERLGSGDEVVEVRFRRYHRLARPAMPETWRLRRVTYKAPGRTKRKIVLLTSIVDPAISAEDLAALYRCRWEQETALDEFKTHLCACATVNIPVLFRSRTPERVSQEFYGLLIAYNAVRKLMAEAASIELLTPERLSFTAALERTREAIYDMSRIPARQLPTRYAHLLRAIARALVPERPNRNVPRVVKIKMSKFGLRTPRKPRRWRTAA